VHATLVVDEILKIVTEKARTIIGAHLGMVRYAPNGDAEQASNNFSSSERYAAWEPAPSVELTPEVLTVLSASRGVVRATRAELEAHPIGIEIQRTTGFPTPLRGWLAARLNTADGRIMGMIQLSDPREGEFSENDEELLLQVAQLASIAIENAVLFEEKRKARRRLETLSRRLLEVQESERRRLARELHDEIGQYLTAMRMSLEMGTRGAPDEMGRRVAETIALINETTERVRELALTLRPAVLDDLGLVQALAWHCERYTARTGIRVTFDGAELAERPPVEVETAAFRIVQESLTNVARHAGVTEASVALRADGGSLVVIVEDEGDGFVFDAAMASPSSGLSGMRERATLLGGELEVRSSPGDGTRVVARIPLALH
jgi:signal transduction histidine kinase